jgi:hypothetical protein
MYYIIFSFAVAIIVSCVWISAVSLTTVPVTAMKEKLVIKNNNSMKIEN